MNKLVDVIKRDNSKTLSVDRNDRVVGAIESVGTNVCIDVNERGHKALVQTRRAPHEEEIVVAIKEESVGECEIVGANEGYRCERVHRRCKRECLVKPGGRWPA